MTWFVLFIVLGLLFMHIGLDEHPGMRINERIVFTLGALGCFFIAIVGFIVRLIVDIAGGA